MVIVLTSLPFLSLVYGKPLLPSSVSSSPVPFQHQSSRDNLERESEPEITHNPQPNVENIPRPLSPTKLTPAHSPLRYQSDIDLEVLRRKLANAPRPLKKRSSITEPEGPNGPNIQKLLYQRFNTLAGGMETVTPFFQPDTALNLPGDVDSVNGNVMEATKKATVAMPISEPAPSLTSDANENQSVQTANHTETPEITDTTDPKEGPEDSHNNNQSSLDKDVKSTPAEKEDTEKNMVSITPGHYYSNITSDTKIPGAFTYAELSLFEQNLSVFCPLVQFFMQVIKQQSHSELRV